MKSKKVWIRTAIVVALIALTAVICIRIFKPKYNYKLINEALGITSLIDDKAQYVDVKAHIYRSSLWRTVGYLNIYNEELIEKGKPSESALSLDEVIDFYGSEFDENGEPRIDSLPDKIEDYLDWYYGLFGRARRIERDKLHEESVLVNAIFGMGVYSEIKNTNRLSDVVIDEPFKFCTCIYLYNKLHPTAMITEDEIEAALAGGPQEPLTRFADWYYLFGDHGRDDFIHGDLHYAYVSYSEQHPDSPRFEDMDLTELHELFEYMETMED